MVIEQRNGLSYHDVFVLCFILTFLDIDEELVTSFVKFKLVSGGVNFIVVKVESSVFE